MLGKMVDSVLNMPLIQTIILSIKMMRLAQLDTTNVMIVIAIKHALLHRLLFHQMKPLELNALPQMLLLMK